MRALRPVLVGSLLITVLVGALAPGAGADTYTNRGVGWLDSRQKADGGFELADFPPFETPDAVLAIATDAQTAPVWSTSEARAAVAAVDNNGVTALDWLGDYAEGPGRTPGTSAKLILLAALPLGDDPTAYNPDGDATSVDLTAGLDDIAPGLFNSFLFGRLAESAMGENVHQADLQVICESQKVTGGGWSYDADPAGPNSADLDSTGFAVMALHAAGVPDTDPVMGVAETFIHDAQAATGAWPSFGADDPNATALAMMGWLALGNGLGALDHDPVAWLRGQQLTSPAEDLGRFPSPNDQFSPVNTFSTSQAIQALHLGLPTADWLPRPAEATRRCLAPDTYTDVPADAWYDDGARWVDEQDIVSGVGGALRPRGTVNRAQAAMWLNLMFDGVGGPLHAFVDVPAGAWYEDGVNFVGSSPNGPIATGFRNQFRPRQVLNRAQAAAWLFAAAGSPDVSALPAPGFTDVTEDAWYRDAVTWAKADGIVSGFSDNTFRGSGEVNRAQMSQWLFNLAATPEAWADDAQLVPSTVLFAPA